MPLTSDAQDDIDAHLAALLRQNGVRTLYTTDADFRKFDFLDLRNPLGP